jgi:hypothetical protein
MSAVSLPITEAFTSGAELWIIKNDPALPWWSKIDFSSSYLLSENFFRPEKTVSEQLLSILEATKFDTHVASNSKNFILLGTQDHFLNKWILVWNQLSEPQVVDCIVELSEKLKFSSVRFFSDSKSLVRQLEARPSASLLNISFIENT